MSLRWLLLAVTAHEESGNDSDKNWGTACNLLTLDSSLLLRDMSAVTGPSTCVLN